MIKEEVVKLFKDIELSYKEKQYGPRELSSTITYLFSLFNKNENSKKRIINNFEAYQEVYPYIISYLENPNCKCRAHIQKFIENNLNLGSEIFLKNLNEEESEELLKVIKNACSSFHENLFGEEFKLYGKVFQIENSKEEYLKVLQKFNKDPRFKYKGVQIIKSEDGKLLDLYFY